MSNISTNISAWFYVIAAVGVASLGNYVSAVWASGENKFSAWLLFMVLISPLVFITFGLVVARTGLAVAAGAVDALLTTTTIIIGLVFFREWAKVSLLQYLGMIFSLVGICLMLFFPKSGT